MHGAHSPLQLQAGAHTSSRMIVYSCFCPETVGSWQMKGCDLLAVPSSAAPVSSQGPAPTGCQWLHPGWKAGLMRADTLEPWPREHLSREGHGTALSGAPTHLAVTVPVTKASGVSLGQWAILGDGAFACGVCWEEVGTLIWVGRC